jgi:hypothetical protein
MNSLSKRTIVARSKAGVEVVACSRTGDEVVAFSGARIEDCRWW